MKSAPSRHNALASSHGKGEDLASSQGKGEVLTSSQGKGEVLTSSQGKGKDDDDDDDAVDSVFKQYETKQLVGKGGYGKVLGHNKGYNLGTGSVVAIKFASIDEGCPWGAERELAHLKRLRHDSIVPLWEYFGPAPTRDEAVFVYPLREPDLSLCEFLQRREADRWMKMFGVNRDIIELWSHQLARGVAYMHYCKLVHRNLKPSNILLKWRQEAGLHLEIADLGYSVTEKSPPPENAKTMNVVGTESYAAPEVWFEGNHGYPMDIWSFGAIVFEMITLKQFTRPGSDVEMVISVLSRLSCRQEAESQHVLGPRQQALVASALKVLTDGTKDGNAFPVSFRALAAISKSSWGLWDCISAALRWRPEARIHAKTLCEKLAKRFEQVAQRDLEFDVQRAVSPGLGAGLQLELDEAKLRPPKKLRLCESWSSSTCSTRTPPPSDLVLSPCQTPVARKGPQRCKCAGGCLMSGHRYRADNKRPVCSSTSLVEGCGLCLDCKCSVLSCLKPKSRSEFCYRHKDMMKKLPWRFHAIRAARHFLPRMIPCDIIVIVEVFDQLKTMGLCSMLLAAWLKEPTAVRAFVGVLSGSESAPSVSADDIFKALVKMLQEVDGPSNVIELQQTTRLGVCRFMGVRTVCQKLCVIGTSPEEVGLGDNAGFVSLGLGADKFYVADKCPDTLRSFVSACNAQDTASAFRKLFDTAKHCDCHGIVSFANTMREIMDIVIDRCLPMTSGMKGYTEQNMIQILTVSWLHSCLGAIAGHNVCVDLCWHSFDFRALVTAGTFGIESDAQEQAQRDIANVCNMRGHISASEISDLLLGRTDHALFVTMWACLFSEVENGRYCRKSKERLIKLLSSPSAVKALDAFIEKHKIPPCPEIFAQTLLGKFP